MGNIEKVHKLSLLERIIRVFVPGIKGVCDYEELEDTCQIMEDKFTSKITSMEFTISTDKNKILSLEYELEKLTSKHTEALVLNDKNIDIKNKIESENKKLIEDLNKVTDEKNKLIEELSVANIEIAKFNLKDIKPKKKKVKENSCSKTKKSTKRKRSLTCKKIKDAEIRHHAGETLKDIAKEYKVSVSLLSMAIAGTKYKDCKKCNK